MVEFKQPRMRAMYTTANSGFQSKKCKNLLRQHYTAGTRVNDLRLSQRFLSQIKLDFSRKENRVLSIPFSVEIKSFITFYDI